MPPALTDLLPPRGHLAPRRKLRGQRRYYDRLRRDASEATYDRDGWFDLWHYHADWDGIGNLSAKHRRAHLDAHLAFLRRAAADLPNRTEPFQLWLYLSDADAGTDAVYVHTPNPNGTPFPIHPNVAWDEDGMTELLDREFGMVGLRAGRDPYRNIYIYQSGVGVSLER